MASNEYKNKKSHGEGASPSPLIKWNKLFADDNDNTIASAFAEHYGTNHRFDLDNKAWLVWQDRRWQYDIHNQALHNSIELMVNDLKALSPAKSSQMIKNVVKILSNNRSRTQVITMLSTHPDLGIRHDEFDAHAHLISLINGAYNLDTGQFIHEESALRPLYLHKQMHVAFNSTATCPQWLEFLDRIFLQDESLIRYVQKIMALSLYGNVSEEKLFMAYGSGKNGKTTLYNVIKQIMGHYAVAIPSLILLQSRIKDQRIVYEVNDSLENARLAIASELPEQSSFDSISLKQLCSRDNITAKRIYNPVYSFSPSHQLHIHANYLPNFNAQDRALLRRIVVIPFDYRVPDSETIENYDKVLLKEAPGILNWLIDGWALYKKEGLRDTPTRVQEIMQNYTDDCDILNSFIDNCCTRGDDLKCTLKEFYDVFSSHQENRRLERKTVSRRLRDAGYTVKAGSGNISYIYGLQIDRQYDNTTFLM